jgi:methylglutaconyl-CoA hydratase
MSGPPHNPALRAHLDDRGVLTLSLNRPDRFNALSAELMDALTDAGRWAAGNAGRLRAVVLTGAGPGFCAGGDLTWMRDHFHADRATRLAEGMRLARMLKTVHDLPMPVVVRLHGRIIGGGLALAAIADIAVAAEDAVFGLPEARLGLVPATIAPYVVARIGEGWTRRLFCAGRSFDAAEARLMGLAHVVVRPDALDAAIGAEIDDILACAPRALSRAKALARALGPVIDDAVIADTLRRLADAWEDAEAHDGVAAFLGKTRPPWR